jgi:hypothetical protein
MRAESNALDYYAPAAAPPQPAGPPGPASMFTGPDRVGCTTMLVVLVLASGLSLGIVTVLAWVLA